MTHKPSPRKIVRDYLLSHGYHDNILKETIALPKNRNSPSLFPELAELLQSIFGEVDMNAIFAERAEVLEDSLGRGTLQK